MKTRCTFILCLVVLLVVVLSALDISAVQDNETEGNDDWDSRSINEIHAVRGIIYSWIDAWQSKNLDQYMSYYSQKFHSGGADYHGWQVNKAGIFKRPGAIFLEISDLWIFIEDKYADVRFVQRYKDTEHSDVGKKNIKMIHSQDTWKIISEEWKPIAE